MIFPQARTGLETYVFSELPVCMPSTGRPLRFIRLPVALIRVNLCNSWTVFSWDSGYDNSCYSSHALYYPNSPGRVNRKTVNCPQSSMFIRSQNPDTREYCIFETSGTV